MNFFFFCIFSGLHLRSTEHTTNRMPAEQGGTAGLDHSSSRSGVPLPLSITPSQPQPYDAEYSRMESWMDENPEFIQDYFIR